MNKTVAAWQAEIELVQSTVVLARIREDSKSMHPKLRRRIKYFIRMRRKQLEGGVFLFSTPLQISSIFFNQWKYPTSRVDNSLINRIYMNEVDFKDILLWQDELMLDFSMGVACHERGGYECVQSADRIDYESRVTHGLRSLGEPPRATPILWHPEPACEGEAQKALREEELRGGKSRVVQSRVQAPQARRGFDARLDKCSPSRRGR